MPSNKPKACRAKAFICKCKSHCTTLNSSTGQYEGEGERVHRSTRDRHTRDNCVLATRKLPQPANAMPLGHPMESATSAQSKPITWHSFAQTSIIPSIADYEASQNWIDLLEWKVDNHCHHSVTSPTIPLVFVNDPLLQGEYIPWAPHELAWLNSGLYALVEGKQANKAFLATEYCFFSRLFLRKARTFKSDYIKSWAAWVTRKKSTGHSSRSTLIKGKSSWIPVSHWTLPLFGYLDQTTLFRDPLLSTWSFWSDNKGCINHISHYGRAFFHHGEHFVYSWKVLEICWEFTGLLRISSTRFQNILPQFSTNSTLIPSFINLFAAWSAIASIHTSLGIQLQPAFVAHIKGCLRVSHVTCLFGRSATLRGVLSALYPPGNTYSRTSNTGSDAYYREK